LVGAAGAGSGTGSAWAKGCSETAGATAATGAVSGGGATGASAGVGACAAADVAAVGLGVLAADFSSLGRSFITATAATAATTTAPKINGTLLPLRRVGGYVSSSGDDTGDEATAAGSGVGAGAATGALRIWPGMVWAARAFSVASWLLPATAASLITTAGVEGSSFGM
jgi:hypothetical protein